MLHSMHEKTNNLGLTKSDTNQIVEPKKIEISDLERIGRCTFSGVKTKALQLCSYCTAAPLFSRFCFRVFVFAYTECWCSNAAAHLV